MVSKVYKTGQPGFRSESPAVGGGGYLLSHFRSIIDVVRFNFSVRNGKRWIPHAITTLIRLKKRVLYGSGSSSISLFSESFYIQSLTSSLCVREVSLGGRLGSGLTRALRRLSLTGLSLRLCPSFPIVTARLALFLCAACALLYFLGNRFPRKGLGD